jgi:2-iminobutanoate/2-iminopropanoate deaminase
MQEKKKISTDKAPKAIGPYSQAVRACNLIFVSGQLPIDVATSNIVEGGIKQQTKQVIDNIEAILKSEGLSLEHVVRCDVFLQNMEDFKTVNSIYAERFTGDIHPARQTVEVAKLPMGALIEISCIASA